MNKKSPPVGGLFLFRRTSEKHLKVRWGKEKWWSEAVMEKGTVEKGADLFC
jgi:hypothetical protein